MTNKLNMRLTLATVAIVVFLAVVFAAFVALVPTGTAKAEIVWNDETFKDSFTHLSIDGGMSYIPKGSKVTFPYTGEEQYFTVDLYKYEGGYFDMVTTNPISVYLYYDDPDMTVPSQPYVQDFGMYYAQIWEYDMDLMEDVCRVSGYPFYVEPVVDLDGDWAWSYAGFTGDEAVQAIKDEWKSTISYGYAGEITASIEDLDYNPYTTQVMTPGQYNVHVEWTANGDYAAGAYTRVVTVGPSKVYFPLASMAYGDALPDLTDVYMTKYNDGYEDDDVTLSGIWCDAEGNAVDMPETPDAGTYYVKPALTGDDADRYELSTEIVTVTVYPYTIYSTELLFYGMTGEPSGIYYYTGEDFDFQVNITDDTYPFDVVISGWDYKPAGSSDWDTEFATSVRNAGLYYPHKFDLVYKAGATDEQKAQYKLANYQVAVYGGYYFTVNKRAVWISYAATDVDFNGYHQVPAYEVNLIEDMGPDGEHDLIVGGYISAASFATPSIVETYQDDMANPLVETKEKGSYTVYFGLSGQDAVNFEISGGEYISYMINAVDLPIVINNPTIQYGQLWEDVSGLLFSLENEDVVDLSAIPEAYREHLSIKGDIQWDVFDVYANDWLGWQSGYTLIDWLQYGPTGYKHPDYWSRVTQWKYQITYTYGGYPENYNETTFEGTLTVSKAKIYAELGTLNSGNSTFTGDANAYTYVYDGQAHIPNVSYYVWAPKAKGGTVISDNQSSYEFDYMLSTMSDGTSLLPIILQKSIAEEDYEDYVDADKHYLFSTRITGSDEPLYVFNKDSAMWEDSRFNYADLFSSEDGYDYVAFTYEILARPLELTLAIGDVVYGNEPSADRMLWDSADAGALDTSMAIDDYSATIEYSTDNVNWTVWFDDELQANLDDNWYAENTPTYAGHYYVRAKYTWGVYENFYSAVAGDPGDTSRAAQEYIYCEFDITKREAIFTITPEYSVTFDGEEHAPNVTLSNMAIGDDVTMTYEKKVNAGKYTLVITELSDMDNYSLPELAKRSMDWEILPLEVGAAWSYDDSYVYTGVEQKAPSASYWSYIVGKNIDLTPVEASGKAFKNAGDYHYTVASADPNYVVTSYTSLDVTIDKNVLTVTVANDTVEYGTAFTPTGYSISGFLGEDTVAVVSGAPALTTERTQFDSTAKTYPIVATLGTLAADNYDFTYEIGTLTVTKKDMAVSFDSVATVPYGTQAPFAFYYDNDAWAREDDKTNDSIVGNIGYVTDYTIESVPGDYEVTINGLTSVNYNIIFAKGGIHVDKASLTIMPNDVTIESGAGIVPDYTFSAVGFVLGQDIDDLEGSLVYVCDYDDAVLGDYTISLQPGCVTSDNYDINLLTTAKLHVTESVVIVTLNAIPDVTYGDALPAIASIGVTYTWQNAAGKIGDPNPENITGTLAYDTAYVVGNGIGSAYTAKASGLSSTTYNLQFASTGFTVVKAPLTLTAKNVAITYGDSIPTFDFDVEGLKVSDTKDMIAYKMGTTYDPEVIANRKVGTYAINFISTSIANYAITPVAGTLTVGKRDITLMLAEQTFTYGDDIQLVAPAVTSGSFAFDDKWTDVASVNFNLNSTSNIGTYWISLASKANMNYNDTVGGANYKINKAQLTNVSVAQTGTLTYNKAEQTASVATTATAVNGLDVKFFYSATEGSGFTSEEVPAFTTAGEYTVYYEAYEYNHERKPGSFVVTIGKATYDMSAVKFENKTVDYSGVSETIAISGDLPEGVSVSYENNTRKNAGAQTATAIFAGDFNNYVAIDNMTATLTINKITATIVPNVLSKTYGEADPELTFSWVGTANGEEPEIIGELIRVEGENAGSYLVSFRKNQYGFKNADDINNYNISFDDTVLFTINRKAVELKLYVDGAVVTEKTTIVYDAAEHTFVVKADGVKGEVLTINDETYREVFSSSDFTVEAQVLNADGFEAKNYVLEATFNVPDYAITKRAASIKADAKTSVYGDALNAITFTKSNLVDADEQLFSYTCNVVNAFGDYAIDVTYTKYALDNYSLNEDCDAVYSVTKRAITIAVDAKSAKYGDEQIALTAVVKLDADANGIAIIGEDKVYSLICAVSKTTDIGKYDITVVSAENPNYALTVSGEKDAYTVVPRDITITIQPKTSIFGDALAAFTADDSAIVNGDKGVYSLASTVTATSAVGSYAITGTALDPNYAITFEAEADAYTLTQRELTLTWGNASFVYNNANQLPTATIGNTVDGQAVKLTVSGEKKAAGTYTATTSIDNDNYVLPAESTKQFVIAKKALTVTANDSSITYGDYVPTYTESYEGFAEGEDKAVLGGELALTCEYKQYTKAGTYDIVPSGYTSDNYEITFVKGTLTVAAAEFEDVAVADDGKVSVEIDNKATATSNGVDINKIIESAAKAGANAGVTLTVGEGEAASTIVLDAAAINALKDKDVKLTYTVKTGDAAASAQKGAELVLDITLNGMTDGSATITVPFVDNAPTGKVAKVFYVDENGKKVDMQGTFADGKVTFTTTHNSTYMVAYVLSTATIVGIAVAAAAVVAIVIVLVIVLGKKKKSGGAAATAAATAGASSSEETH